jgi:AcrR family transcriptional regulator
MARRPAPDTRERILDAADRLFYAHGVNAIGVQQIVDECGLGKSLLYREFGGKDDLVAAYLDRRRGLWDRLLERELTPLAGDPAGQLVALARIAAEQTASPEYRGCPYRICDAELADRGHPAVAVTADYLSSVRDLVRQLAGQAGAADPDTLGERVWLIIEGLYASAAHPGGERAAEVAVALVQELVDRAVQAEVR